MQAKLIVFAMFGLGSWPGSRYQCTASGLVCLPQGKNELATFVLNQRRVRRNVLTDVGMHFFCAELIKRLRRVEPIMTAKIVEVCIKTVKKVLYKGSTSRGYCRLVVYLRFRRVVPGYLQAVFAPGL